MKNNVIPSLWFKDNAMEAMEYYSSIFPNSGVSVKNSTVVCANLSGVEFMALNGGTDKFKPNPSISFMVVCEKKEEINHLWNELKSDGKVYMELDRYPWSEYYGWIGDKYRNTWQLYMGSLDDVNNQKIVPTLMFSHIHQGKCEEAIAFYESLFPDFKSYGIMRYLEGEFEGQIMHSQFKINDFVLAAMDSGVKQSFTFNKAISLTIQCKNQQEINYYWNKITENGRELQCGWCQDEYGVFWQVVPYNMENLVVNSPNAKRAFEALMKMNKIEIKELENA